MSDSLEALLGSIRLCKERKICYGRLQKLFKMFLKSIIFINKNYKSKNFKAWSLGEIFH